MTSAFFLSSASLYYWCFSQAVSVYPWTTEFLALYYFAVFICAKWKDDEFLQTMKFTGLNIHGSPLPGPLLQKQRASTSSVKCFWVLQSPAGPLGPGSVSHTNVQAELSSAPFAPSSLVTCLGQIEWPLGVNTGAGGKEKNWLASSLAWLLPSFCPSYSLPPSLPPGSRGLNPWMSVAVPVQSVSGVSGIRGTSPLSE